MRTVILRWTSVSVAAIWLVITTLLNTREAEDLLGISINGPWMIGIAVIIFAAVVLFNMAQMQLQINALTELKPHLVFVGIRDRANVTLTEYSGGQAGSSHVESISASSGASFTDAEFRNYPKNDATSIIRPHISISYYTEDGRRVERVLEGRITKTRQRSEDVLAGKPGIHLKPQDVRLEEIRVGETVFVDLLMRRPGQSVAHTWSDDDETMGRYDFQPGTAYVAGISFNADNMTETFWLAIDIPSDPKAPLDIRSTKKPDGRRKGDFRD
ncbi:MAG TPA: hypothetical protein VIW01_05875 [Dehalococcoidia bacterium]